MWLIITFFFFGSESAPKKVVGDHGVVEGTAYFAAI